MGALKNKFVAVILLFIVMSLTAYTVKTSESSKAKTELIMVEVIFGFEGNKDVSGIYTTFNNGETKKVVNLVGYVGQENISLNAKSIHKYLKDTYADGWELESATGGDNAKRYIFRK